MMIPNNHYKMCSRCIMDTSDPRISFDQKGLCNHCREYDERARNELYCDQVGQEKLKRLLKEIKAKGKHKKYDCLIGLSGGVDSTLSAYLAKRWGLRPLAVHLDNGWDPELAVANIEKIVKVLDIDLQTYVLNWEEFRDLQLSFLKASVANAEIPTDHAIVACLYRTAKREGIHYILNGSNIVTEAIMPAAWGYGASDWRHLKAIHKRFGNIKLKIFPHLNLSHWVYYTFVRRLKFIPILNYIHYNRQEAKKLMAKELGWQDYGAKHFESIYTRFFQAYILPTKFGFDKRRAHLSTLICSGQIRKDEALKEMKREPYPDKKMLREDKIYVIKKLGLTEKEFDKVIKQPPRTYLDYPNNARLFDKLNFFVKFAKKKATYN